MTITDARHLPIVKAYAQKIGLVETIDKMVDSQMELSPGMAVIRNGPRHAIRTFTALPVNRIL